MNKNDVIRRLCAMCTQVNDEVFGYSVAADCFCDVTQDGGDFQFDPVVLDFIGQAVHVFIQNHKRINGEEVDDGR